MDDRERPRLMSLDSLRGLTMLILIPDVFGAYSFYEMASRYPESALWSSLARVFSHAQWSGATPWDLIMPAFVFMVGVSMPYSYAARKREGRSHADTLAHAALRAVALLLLGLLIQIPARNVMDSLWPFLILALGLPVPAWLSRSPGSSSTQLRRFEWLWWATILLACGVRVALEVRSARSFSLHDILPQVGLGYLFAFLLVARGRRSQVLTVGAILTACWVAFLLFPLSPPGSDLRSVGVLPGEEVFTGYFAHWNKGTNLAAAFDRWLFNILPRSTPFAFNSHGYQSLNFIPTIASLILGVMVGEHLRQDKSPRALRNDLFTAGGLVLLGGLVAGWTLSPIVKSIWTPSWVLFSTGCVVLVFTLTRPSEEERVRQVPRLLAQPRAGHP